MKSERLPNWELALDRVIGEASAHAFVWGSHDCCCFAAGVIKAITGEDPMKGLRGYKSEGGAQKVLKSHGWASVYRALHAILGKSIPVAQAQRGDVVFAKLEGGTFTAQSGAGICLGAVSAFPGELGLVYLPTHKATRAWPTGRPHPKRRR